MGGRLPEVGGGLVEALYSKKVFGLYTLISEGMPSCSRTPRTSVRV